MEDFEDKLMELISHAQTNGMSDDEIVSSLELRIMAINEAGDEGEGEDGL